LRRSISGEPPSILVRQEKKEEPMKLSPKWIVAMVMVLGAVGADAQYTPGDLIVGCSTLSSLNPGALLGVNSQGKAYTVTPQLTLIPMVVAPSPDNRTLWVTGYNPGTAAGEGIQIAPDGTVTALFPPMTTFYPSAIEVDDGGTALVCDAYGGGVCRYSQGGFTTLYGNFTCGLDGAAIDINTGDLIVYEMTGPLYRLPLHGPASTTQLTSLQALAVLGLHTDPRSGDMIATTGGTIYGLRFTTPLTMSTMFVDSTNTLQFGILDRDPQNGTFLVPGSFLPVPPPPPQTPPPPTGHVFRFDSATGVLTTVANLGACCAGSVTVAGSRHLGGVGYARIGSTYGLRVSFPTRRGFPYVVALSFGFRAGIPTGAGRAIQLDPDPLFFYSLTSAGIFSGFQGILNARGEAVATLLVPGVPALRGKRFYASALTLASGGVDRIADTIGVTIR